MKHGQHTQHSCDWWAQNSCIETKADQKVIPLSQSNQEYNGPHPLLLNPKEHTVLSARGDFVNVLYYLQMLTTVHVFSSGLGLTPEHGFVCNLTGPISRSSWRQCVRVCLCACVHVLVPCSQACWCIETTKEKLFSITLRPLKSWIWIVYCLRLPAPQYKKE